MVAAIVERALAQRLEDQGDGVARRAWDLFEAGDIPGAFHLYKQLEPSYPQSAELLGLIGVTLFHLDRLAEAAAYLRRAVEVKPKDPSLLMAYGATLGRMGRYEDALHYLEEALRLEGPSSFKPEILHNAVLALLGLNRLKEAVELIDEAFSLDLEPAEKEDFFQLRKALVAKQLDQLAASGFASWSGGKPKGSFPPIEPTSGPPISDYVIQDRR